MIDMAAGLEPNPNPREMTATIHEETASVSPFGRPDWRSARAVAQKRPKLCRANNGGADDGEATGVISGSCLEPEQ
jgi:hypothetical protein